MTTFSLQPWSRTPTEFADDHIEQWQASLIDQSTILEDPHRIPVSLGLERRLEIIWAALVLPLLMKDSVDDRAPVLQNIDHLVHIYNTGIDLLSTETQQNLDKDDLLHLCTSTENPIILTDCLESFAQLMQFKKEHPSLLQRLQDTTSAQALLLHAEAWGEPIATIHLMSILPLIEITLLSGHHSFEQDLQLEYVDAITAHALWSSGIVDSLITQPSDDEDTLAEDMLQGIGTVLSTLAERMAILPGALIRKLHAYHVDKQIEQRVWIWGHTAR